jgi:hypothetical protein
MWRWLRVFLSVRRRGGHLFFVLGAGWVYLEMVVGRGAW